MTDGEGQAPEDLSVSLSWPGDDQEETQRAPSGKAPAPEEPAPETGPRGLWRRRGPATPPREPSTAPTDTPPVSLTDTPSVSPTAPPPVSSVRAPAASFGGSDLSLAQRVEELAGAVASTTGRLDTLTDAVVTLRGLVNERMGDVGDAVTRSQTLIAREVGDALDRAQSQIAHNLNEAVLEARAQLVADLADAASEGQVDATRALSASLDRLESQTIRRSTNDDRRYEQTTTAMKAALGAAEEGVRRIDKAGATISTELATIGQRLSDQAEVTSNRTLSDLAALGEHLGTLVDGITETSRADLAAATRRLTNEVMTAVTAADTESRQQAEQVSADISALGDSVADALTQVADRLEQLALNNHGQQDVVEAVAQALDDVAARMDDLDSSNRSRHERIVAAIGDLRSKRSQAQPVDLGSVTGSLERIETFVEALVDATDAQSDAGPIVAAAERIQDLEGAIADQVDEAAAKAVRNLTDAAERAANQIRTAVPPVTERSTLAAMTRIEGRMAEMSRQREEHDEAAQEALDALEETVGRLASAQAEDLERILDTVESAPAAQPSTLSLSAPDAERLARIEEELRKLGRQPRATGVSPDIDGTALEQMASLGSQIEALRRRMAVRARPQAPTLDPEALEAIAEAVAARLAPAGGSGRSEAPVKRAARKAATPGRSAAPRKSTSARRKPDS